MKPCPKPQKTKKVKKKKVVSEKKKLDKECRDLWSKCVIARDKTCRYTNEDTFLSAHHIRSVTHKATRFLLDNGLTLSWRKVHFLQKMNPEKFQDMVIEIIGEDFYQEMKRKSQVVVDDYTVDDLTLIKADLKAKLKELELGNYENLPF